MVQFETKTKEWGNSLGVIIPKDQLAKGHIGKNDVVIVLVRKKTNVLNETFGMLKGKRKKSGQEMKDEIRRELHQIE